MTRLPMCAACGSTACTAFAGSCASIIECKDRQLAALSGERPAQEERATQEVGTAEYWHDRFTRCLAMLEEAQGKQEQSEREAARLRQLAHDKDREITAYEARWEKASRDCDAERTQKERLRELLSRVHMWRGSGLPSGLWKDIATELNGQPAEAAPVLSHEDAMDAMGDEIERHPIGGHGDGRGRVAEAAPVAKRPLLPTPPECTKCGAIDGQCATRGCLTMEEKASGPVPVAKVEAPSDPVGCRECPLSPRACCTGYGRTFCDCECHKPALQPPATTENKPLLGDFVSGRLRWDGGADLTLCLVPWHRVQEPNGPKAATAEDLAEFGWVPRKPPATTGGADRPVRPTPPRHELVAHDYRELARTANEIAQRLENGELLKFDAEEAKP